MVCVYLCFCVHTKAYTESDILDFRANADCSRKPCGVMCGNMWVFNFQRAFVVCMGFNCEDIGCMCGFDHEISGCDSNLIDAVLETNGVISCGFSYDHTMRGTIRTLGSN